MLSFSKHLDDDASILEPNMTPLIDIVFLLLIFFMLSTTFIDSSRLGVELPKASSASSKQEDKVVEIQITQAGVTQIDGKVVEAAALREQLGALPADSYLLLRADKATSHGNVVRVMDIAQELGITSIGVAVDTK